MLDANYIKHFKVLGKLARLYDDAAAASDVAALKTLAMRLFDQAATGESPSYDAVLVLSAFMSPLDLSINAVTNNVRATVKTMAAAYLVHSLFRADLTTTPASANDAASVLAALRTDMSAGVDNKKLTTEAATGLVNFFKNVMAAGGSWNSIADASADYKDSVYVVTAVV